MHSATTGDTPRTLELTLSDPTQLRGLRDWLRAQDGISVRVRPAAPAPGELGTADVLAVLAGSSVLAAAVKTLPDFLRSRRSNLRMRITVDGRQVEVESENTDRALELVERLLRDSP
ncbi:effector-associated constant component EACC1 [Streptomyces sp. NPDC001443]